MQLVGGLVGLGSLVCFIIVLIKMFSKEGVLKGILGLICGIYAFVWGWQNHEELEIKNIMIIWSILVVINIVISILFQPQY